MNPGQNSKRTAASLLLVSGVGFRALGAGDIDPGKLPPPATNHVVFARDIKPLLELSCLRCHGPEKAKSGFRLDNRNSVLTGGDNGVDLIPGDSAKSPFIHYITHLVPDMDMPPAGKGEPLTAAQIALFRAWIDQGVAWDTATNNTEITLTPIFGGTVVNGDNHKFRELNWQKEGINGGAEDFRLFEQINPDTKLALTGHALRDDYKINLDLYRNELGSVRGGWEQYRKYFDDTGGYRPSPTTPSALSRGQDLHLDIGKAWIDFGLTLPHWPELVLGYEYDYKKGNESITSWGNAGIGNNDARNIVPASKYLNEGVHIIKFDLDGDIKGVTVEERFRGEFYKLDTTTTNLAARNPVANNTTDENRYFQGMNTLRLERQFTGWLYGSAGYLYSKLDADGTLNNLVTYQGTTTFFSMVPTMMLEKESHVANLNVLVGPFDGLTLTAGAQSEWTRQHGFAQGNLNRFTYTLTAPNTLPVTPTTLVSEYDETSVSETAALRYSKIPFTVMFADARLQQETIGQYDDDYQSSGNFMENPSFSSRMTDFRAGFNTSPWQFISLSADYRRYENDSRYKTNDPPQPPGGYPGFLLARDLHTDEAEAKLVLRLCSRIKTTLSYQYATTKYWEQTTTASIPAPPTIYSSGGELLAGRSRSDIYSIDTTFTPVPRICLYGAFSYQPTTLFTATAGSPVVAPYNGDIYTVIANGTYVWSESTDLFGGYAFSEANYPQNDAAQGLPLGIQYQRHSAQAGLNHRFTKNFTGRLQYAFDYYNEASSGGANNYRAHSVFGSVSLRFP